MADGSVLVLALPTIVDGVAGGVLVGRIGEHERRLPLDLITRLETRRTEFLPVLTNTAAAVGLLAVVVAVLGTIALVAVTSALV